MSSLILTPAADTEGASRLVGEMLRDRARRRADNQAALGAGSREPFACECAQVECRVTVSLSPDEYLAVRGSPERFVVAPGHERDSADIVVEIHSGYRVVERPPSELFLG